MERQLDSDSFMQMCSFLHCSDLLSLEVVSRGMQRRVDSGLIWTEALFNMEPAVTRIAGEQILGSPLDTASMRSGQFSYEQARALVRASLGLDKMSLVKWKLITLTTPRSQLPRMECHASVLLRDRYMCVIAGWGSAHTNIPVLLDLDQLPIVTQVPVVCTQVPAFTYGFSITKYTDQMLLFYGGFRAGGYSHDTRALYALNINTQGITNETPTVVATYTQPQLAPNSIQSTPRGFHAAVVVTINDRATLLLWGGLHNNEVITCLELYDIETACWRKGTTVHNTSSTSPYPRIMQLTTALQRGLFEVMQYFIQCL